ncbi:MAG TPA: sulfotransferase [Streptosporangiaceae bacterium]|nr:sulfotransferase [Streptosporangiaceae bacterium]
MAQHSASMAAVDERAAAGSFADPVFVLCNGRSGSTLLRFLLDAHPELACPPETNLPGLCVQLATVWSLIEGAPLSANRGDEPPEIPEAAIAGVRHTMDRMVGSYLARRGKKRYCDKSLGTARYAELLLRVYPEARFICVYRHPMDVVASGVEACPWGLNGYGFDPYIAATPGNAVMALANFWVDNAGTTLAVEERFADKCFRLRYEDLVTDPEGTAAELFEFLGVPPAPGISERCFSSERERFGPADYKIWYTSRVSADSVGRGWSVPTAMIAPQLLAAINELAGRLGYLAVDGDWGTTEPPADLRVPIVTPAEEAGPHGGTAGATEVTAAAGRDPAPAEADREPALGAPAAATEAVPAGPLRSEAAAVPAGPVHSERLGEQLRAGLAARPAGDAAGRWGPHASETFVAVAVTKDAGRPAEYWLVDLGAATVVLASQAAQEDSDWDLIGSVDAWERVMAGEVNLSVALRACQLRYCDNGQTTPLAADTRIGIIASLLGLASWE